MSNTIKPIIFDLNDVRKAGLPRAKTKYEQYKSEYEIELER